MSIPFGLSRLTIITIVVLLCGALGSAAYYYTALNGINPASEQPADIKKTEPTPNPTVSAIYSLGKATLNCTGETTKVCTGWVEAMFKDTLRTFQITNATAYSVKGLKAEISELSKQSGKKAAITSEGDQATSIDLQ